MPTPEHLGTSHRQSENQRSRLERVPQWCPDHGHERDGPPGHLVEPDLAHGHQRRLRPKVALSTAVADLRISRNPCQIRGAGIERAPERPIVEAKNILQLAATITPRLRARVFLAGFGGLRRLPGVTAKELMARIGHAWPRAALIHQHAQPNGTA